MDIRTMICASSNPLRYLIGGTAKLQFLL